MKVMAFSWSGGPQKYTRSQLQQYETLQTINEPVLFGLNFQVSGWKMYFDLLFCWISHIFNDNILLRILFLVTEQRWCARGGEGEKHRGRGFSPHVYHQLPQGLQVGLSSLPLRQGLFLFLVLQRSLGCNKSKPPCQILKARKTWRQCW